jgi:hypothetical protein
VPRKILEVFREHLRSKDPARAIREGYDATNVSQYNILEWVAEAAEAAYKENGYYFPDPRGLEVAVDTNGSVALVWESDTHTVRLDLPIKYSGIAPRGWVSGDGHDQGINFVGGCLTISSEDPEGSPRVAAAKKAWPEPKNGYGGFLVVVKKKL